MNTTLLDNALQDKRILIIDDLVEARSSLKKMIAHLGGVRIDVATNGQEAMDFINRYDYDLVLSDYSLDKGKDGQQVLEEARFTKRLKPSALFVLVTGESTLEMVMGALEYEPDHYITKPFTLNMLRERLTRIVRLKEALRPIDEALDNEDDALAIERASSMLAANPRMILPLSRTLGRLYMRQGRYQDALDVYTKVLETRQTVWARIGHAVCQHFLGDSRTALALLEQILMEHPLCVQCHDWAATIHLSNNNSVAAQQALQKAVEISPRAVLRQMELGRIAISNNDFAVAEAAYDQAMKLGRHSCHKTHANYLQLARSVHQQLLDTETQRDPRRQKSMLQTAFKAIEEAREQFSHDPDVLFDINMIEFHTHFALGNEDKARRAVTLAEKLLTQVDLPTIEQQLQMIDAYQRTEQQAKADQIINVLTSMGLKGDYAARLRALQGHVDDSESQREQIAALNAQAVALYEKGNLAEAVPLFDEVVQFEQAGISVLMNAIQAKLALLEKTQVNVEQLKLCYLYFQRIGKINRDDERFERYERLKALFMKLKRAAGL